MRENLWGKIDYWKTLTATSIKGQDLTAFRTSCTSKLSSIPPSLVEVLHEKSTSTGVTFTRNYVTVWIEICVLSRKNKNITAFPWRDFFHIRIGSLYSFSCTTVSFVNQPLSTRVSPLYVPKRSIWIGSFWEPSLHTTLLISSFFFLL